MTYWGWTAHKHQTCEGAQFTQHRATVTSHQTIGNEDGAAMLFYYNFFS